MSLQHEYEDFRNHLWMFCPGKKIDCSKCEGKGLVYDLNSVGTTCCKCGGNWREDGDCYACCNTGRSDGMVTCTTCSGQGYTQEPCGGWILSDFDTWHHCPLHHTNQSHPEDSGPENDCEG